MDSLGLHGSTVLPADVQIGPRRVQIKEVVLRALCDSELSPGDWNQLAPIDREMWMIAAIFAMRAEIEIVYDG